MNLLAGSELLLLDATRGTREECGARVEADVLLGVDSHKE